MAVALFHPDLLRYLDGLVPPRPPELIAMEAEAERTNFPIIGPAAGYFCYLVTRLIGARSVFELGSGFGYSTAWFARGVHENGGGIVHGLGRKVITPCARPSHNSRLERSRHVPCR